MIRRGTRSCTRLYRGITRQRLLLRGPRTVFVDHDYTLPGLACAVATVSGEKFWDVSFISPDNLLAGDATDGWTWTNGAHELTLVMEWSGDLITWTTGLFEDAPGSPAAVTGGYRYTSRSKVPILALDRYADLSIAESVARSITGVNIDGAAVPLPAYPYDLPTEAADLQADMIAEGYTGTVVAAAGSGWTMAVPDVHLTTAAAAQSVSWPSTFEGTGPFGDIYSTGRSFVAEERVGLADFTPINLPKQFARLRITRSTP